MEGQISSLKSENETLQKDNNSLYEQIGNMKANSRRQERLVDVLRKCSLGGNFDKMTHLIGLAASGQEEEMERELDEFYYRASHTRMRQ